ncbi:GNAT family N-acetyltransferase [Myroides pelagicus]|uniref:GNAT family N-acetyltransferase n=1 Tax=Myroides pelagicus TaxID=270914 RepID=A0A7K1GMP4_9FLAO|nr:GNAT family protein [Myroides pelagicus]MEC4113530.1 GNAT family protein [Myroides pelagicus]MTH30078.1 GNAT family N-acetyltransferase [Myroides pelagicus]
MFIQGDNIYLRALEPEDLSFIYEIENDMKLWEVSNTQTPYSRFLIRQYLENAHQDIYEAKQLRLVICDSVTDKVLGLIDLFDYDPKNNRAGVGIVVQYAEDRNKGIGTAALAMIVDYGVNYLHLNQLYANVAVDNKASIALFEQAGFELVGIKKAWTRVGNTYKDEGLYQLIY